VEYLQDIEKLIWRKLDVVENHPFAITVSQTKQNTPKKPASRWRFSWERKRSFRR
jgi:hypothetical protein